MHAARGCYSVKLCFNSEHRVQTLVCKRHGKDSFTKKQHADAAAWYSKSIEHDRLNRMDQPSTVEQKAAIAILYSNRAAAYLKMAEQKGGVKEPSGSSFQKISAAEHALEYANAAFSDAEICVNLQPQWVKGHIRKVASLEMLRRWSDAEQALEQAMVALAEEQSVATAAAAADKNEANTPTVQGESKPPEPPSAQVLVPVAY